MVVFDIIEFAKKHHTNPTMCAHYTSALDQNSCPISFDFSDENVTGLGGLALAKNFIKNQPAYKRFLKVVEKETQRNQKALVKYSDDDLLMCRILALLAGQPYLNGVEFLRHDPGFATALGGDVPSTATLSRQEQVIGRKSTAIRNQAMAAGGDFKKYDPSRISTPTFEAFNKALLDSVLDEVAADYPKRLILDFDSTCIPVYGYQDDSSFCGKNRTNCYFLLMGFMCGMPFWIQSAPGATDGRKLLENCLDFILKTVKARLPNTAILVRADGGFNSDDLISIVEKNDKCFYLLGFGQNSKSLKCLYEQIAEQYKPSTDRENAHLASAILEEVFGSFYQFSLEEPQSHVMGRRIERVCGQLNGYKGKKWSTERKLYYRVQYSSTYNEVDVRFVQTNLTPTEIWKFCRRAGVKKGFTIVMS